MTEDKPHAIVTGGASGLGAAVAETLAGDGFSLTLLDRSAEGLKATAGRLVGEGYDVDVLEVDLLDEPAVTSALTDHPRNSSLKALVNCAGLVGFGTIEERTVDDWDAMIGVKLRGDFVTCKAVMPVLVAHGGGAIVNIASMSGRTKSVTTSPDYVVSNAGVIGLTMSLASQHAAQGVRVNCVAPGMIETPMLDDFEQSSLDSIRHAIPMRRFAEASEIAAVVSFLVSEKASYVTGETINVNGGMFMV